MAGNKETQYEGGLLVITLLYLANFSHCIHIINNQSVWYLLIMENFQFVIHSSDRHDTMQDNQNT